MRNIRLIPATSLLVALALSGCFEGNEDTLDGGVADALLPQPCSEGESQSCFVDDGCAGTQTCTGGEFGACTAPAERCDGLDNNCDGTIDEGFDGLGDACEAGQSTCLDRGTIVCSDDGTATVCNATPGDETAEVCDGIDNDCDGDIDDGVEVGIACDTGIPGVCAAGTTSCEAGDTRCTASADASDETCDGLDNDCDGRVDEDGVGGVLAEPCYEGPEGTEGVGICVGGVSLCVDGAFGACEGQMGPGAEICDGIDNDCDGTADGDGCACLAGETQPCYSGAEGTEGIGACRAGTQTCAGDGTAFGACTDEVVPGVELCDGVDNDCDGETDEVAGVGETCSAGQGACQVDGVRSCDLATGQVVCDAVAGLPADETCDGIDNDCDGITDDLDGIGEPCQTGVGACLARGNLACDRESGGLTCSAVAGAPGNEICDARDNDCDGTIDEVPGVGEPCAVGQGICRSTAVTRCDTEAGEVICPATEQPAEPGEFCLNAADDDCDGSVDEDECTFPCAADDDCRAGTLCEDGTCVPGDCRGDDDCAPGEELCTDGFCMPGDCRGDEDCFDGEICDANFCIEVPLACIGTPVIDEFGTTEGTTAGAPSQVSATCASGARSPENAYQLTLDHTGTICIDTFGSGYDTALYVRTDCPRSGSEIACNDDAGQGFLQSQIELEYDPAGTTYVFVDGFSTGRSGAYALNVRAGSCAACADDGDCVTADRCVPIANVCAPDNCGNGIRDFNEQCDDGGNDAGDGCSARCQIEEGFECTAPDGIADTLLPFDGLVNCGNPAAAATAPVPAWPAYRGFADSGAVRVTGGDRWQTQASIVVNGVEVVRIPFVGEAATPEAAFALLRGLASPLFAVPEEAIVGAYFRDGNCGDNAGGMAMRVRAVDFCYSVVCQSDDDCLFGRVCGGGTCVEPIDTDADGIDDSRDLDTDGDGIPNATECFGDLEGQVALINGGFEIPGGFATVNQDAVPGWNTTAADGAMELWNSGFLGVPSAEGGHFAELNANVQGALYQDITTVPGTRFDIRFFHRGRGGVENMELRIGPPGATVQILRATTGVDAWQQYVASYTVPDGQILTRFEFASLDPGSVGNFLDGIQFDPRCDDSADEDGDDIPNQLDLDSDGDGMLDAEEAGHDLPHTNGVVDGPVGENGLTDALETAPGSGIINYEIRDTDGDGAPDFLQIGPFACGNGAIDGDEACDDGNRDDGDGCSSECAVEDNYECSEPGDAVRPCEDGEPFETVALTPGQALPAIGGDGGNAFDDVCGPGQVVIGFDLAVGPWGGFPGPNFITQSQAACASFDVVGDAVVLAPTRLTPVRGVTGQINNSVRCPAGHVVTGYVGYDAGGGQRYVAGLALVCSPVGVEAGRVVVGAPVETAPVGNTSNRVGRFDCGPAQLVGANFGRSGDIVDRFTMRCDDIVEGCRQQGSVCEFTGECQIDADCAADQLCRGNTCVDLGVCPDDDAFEPNNSADAAAEALDGRYEDLAVCGNDDYYAIDLCEGGTLTINLYFRHSGGDVDIMIVGGPASAGTADDERVTLVNGGPDRTVVWRVYGFLGAQNTYAMDVTVDGCDAVACLADEDCPDGNICIDGTCEAPLDSDGDGIDDLRDFDDDNDGIPDAAECFGTLEGQVSVINGGFEEPVIAIRDQVPNAAVPGWNTTEGGGAGSIELWNNGIDGVPAAAGNAFAEINANEADGALYQDIATVPGTAFTYSFYHRGRLGVDVMELRAGPPDAAVQIVTATTDNLAWRRYTGTYVVPEGQFVTRLEFRSISSTGGAGLGNFIDGVEFAPQCPANADEDGDGTPNSLDLDSDGDGLFDAEEAGHDLPHTDGRVDGPVGGNGLVDAVETIPDSASLNYEIRDTNGDGIPDFLQIGSGEPLCADGREPRACPAGFNPTPDGLGCELLEQVPARANGALLPVCRSVQDGAWGANGVVLPGGRVIGGGFFGNGSAGSRLNTVGVWACGPGGVSGADPVNERIGFARCFELAQGGEYVIGIGVDNIGSASIDGELIVDGVDFLSWRLVPAVLSAGTHIITLEGINGGGPGGLGAEIYGPFPPGSTASDDALAGLDYANNVVFTSLEQIGGVFDTGVTSGFSCDDGFALDLCGDAPLCTRFERADRCEPAICLDGGEPAACPDGFESTADGLSCERLEQVPAQANGVFLPVCRAIQSGAWGQNGVQLPGGRAIGGGFFGDGANGSRLNTVGVWTCNAEGQPLDVPVNEPIGFSRCFQLDQGGEYVIGLSADDNIIAQVDGVEVLRQNGALFSWYLVPAVLSAGTHVITLEGVNGGGAGGIGAEIYGPFPPGSTANDDAMAVLDYANNVVFTSLDQIGDVFDTGVTSGFSCDDGFALDLCGDAPLCTRFERIDACAQPVEDCDNGADDDADGDTDCGDIDCRDDPACDIERTFYFTTPAQAGNPTPAAPTRLYATNAAGQPQLLGDITVDGTPVIVTAIALTTGGALIGFMFDPAGPTSTAIVIDPDTAIGVRVAAPPAPVHIIGAGYDPQNRLWVLDRTNQQIREYTQLGGLEAPQMPFPVQLDGGDIAFDQNGDCYLTGDSLNGDVQRDLYRCNLAARTTTSLGPLSAQGFVDGAGGVFVSGMAFSLDDETCESTLFALDGRAIDELGVIDVSGEPPTITQVASTGINFSWYTNPDGAGFPSVANSPACDR